jgi:DNA-binding transcriptional LysR family regulator
MFDYIWRALDMIWGGESRFQEMLNLERGHISIGASDSICKHFLLRHLETFHERYPNLEIHVTNRTSHETIRLLKDGDVDIGFVNLPMEEDPQLVFIPCFKLHDCFVAGPKHFDAIGRIRNLKSLSEQPILLLERDSNTRRKLDEFLADKGITLKPAIELGSLDLLVEFARIGLGFACVIEEFVSEELASGMIRRVELEEELPERAIGLVHMKNIPVSHAAKSFMNIVLEQP